MLVTINPKVRASLGKVGRYSKYLSEISIEISALTKTSQPWL
jgi:hypothetical protein